MYVSQFGVPVVEVEAVGVERVLPTRLVLGFFAFEFFLLALHVLQVLQDAQLRTDNTIAS